MNAATNFSPESLRETRLAQDRSLRSVGFESGYTESYLSRVERAQQQISLEALWKLARVLKLDELADVLEPFIVEKPDGVDEAIGVEEANGVGAIPRRGKRSERASRDDGNLHRHKPNGKPD